MHENRACGALLPLLPRASLLEVDLEERVRNPRRFLLIQGRLSRRGGNGVLQYWSLVLDEPITPLLLHFSTPISTPSHDEEIVGNAGVRDLCRSRCHSACERRYGCGPDKVSRIVGMLDPAGDQIRP
jgi:hypothetical protein